MKKTALLKKIGKRGFWLDRILYIAVFAALVCLAFQSPYFLTVSNMISALKSAAPILMVSIGLTFVLIARQMDLSVGSIVLASASFSALLMTRANWNPGLCMVLCVLFGTVFGMLNGLFIVVLGLNPWLVTLATQLLLKGVAFTLTKATSIRLPSEISELRKIKLGSLPVYVIIAFAIAIMMQMVLKYTKYGRSVSALGSNPDAAAKIGMPVKKLRFSVCTLAGLFAGIGAVMAAINLGTVTQSMGNGYEFLGVTMVVIGGTSMSGGSGSVFPATVFGVLMITLLENGLSIVGMDPYYFGIMRGLIIFAAVYLDCMKNRKQGGIGGVA